jgi:hypothetical protein
VRKSILPYIRLTLPPVYTATEKLRNAMKGIRQLWNPNRFSSLTLASQTSKVTYFCHKKKKKKNTDVIKSSIRSRKGRGDMNKEKGKKNRSVRGVNSGNS